jgi:hypothetical protein
VVRHKAPGPYRDFGGAAVLGEQVAVKRVVDVAEKGARAAIAALSDMVRMTGDDDTGETGHAASCPRRRCQSIKCTVTVITAVQGTDSSNPSVPLDNAGPLKQQGKPLKEDR